MGGEEEAILKHKIQVRDKNHLTNNKPKLDIMSQDRIPIPGLKPIKQRNTRPLARTKLQVY